MSTVESFYEIVIIRTADVNDVLPELLDRYMMIGRYNALCHLIDIFRSRVQRDVVRCHLETEPPRWKIVFSDGSCISAQMFRCNDKEIGHGEEGD